MNRSLDTFRAFSFLLVCLFHLGYCEIGYLGVFAFFVLSGFLITPILIKTKEFGYTFKEYLINFYARRSLRIFPAYYLYLLLAVLLIFTFGVENQTYYRRFLIQLPWAITYTYDFYHPSVLFKECYLISHFWSLAVEEQFYLFWPFVIFFIPKRFLKTIFILIIIGGPVIRFLLGVIAQAGFNPWLVKQTDLVVYFLPFSHLDAFVMGGFFSLFVKENIPSPKVVLSYGFVLLIFGMVLTELFYPSVKLTSLGYPRFMIDSLKYIWGYSAFGIFFGALISNLNKRTFLPVIFENKTLAYIGRISYGLYIYHLPAIYLVRRYNKTVGKPTLLDVAEVFAITFFFSIISFELFEKKILALKDKYFPKKDINIGKFNKLKVNDLVDLTDDKL